MDLVDSGMQINPPEFQVRKTLDYFDRFFCFRVFEMNWICFYKKKHIYLENKCTRGFFIDRIVFKKNSVIFVLSIFFNFKSRNYLLALTHTKLCGTYSMIQQQQN